MKIWIAIHAAAGNRGFDLQPATMARLAGTGATLSFDLYFEGEGETEG